MPLSLSFSKSNLPILYKIVPTSPIGRMILILMKYGGIWDYSDNQKKATSPFAAISSGYAFNPQISSKAGSYALKL